MTKLWLKKVTSFELRVYDEQGFQKIEKLPFDIPLFGDVVRKRNYERLKLYHALIDVVAKGVGVDHESMDEHLRINLGYYRDVTWPDGRVQRRATSIGYENMPDEATFMVFFEKAVAAIYMLYGILPSEQKRQIDEMLAPRAERRR